MPTCPYCNAKIRVKDTIRPDKNRKAHVDPKQKSCPECGGRLTISKSSFWPLLLVLPLSVLFIMLKNWYGMDWLWQLGLAGIMAALPFTIRFRAS